MSPRQIRLVVVTDRSTLIREFLSHVQSLPLESSEEFSRDPHMVAAGESYLRRALEALLDLGRHVLAKGFGIPAVEYKEIPRFLGKQGVLTPRQADLMTKMAGYRNRLVHLYFEITPGELFVILSQHVDEILEILAAIEEWAANVPDSLDDSL